MKTPISSETNTTTLAEVIKLGVDVHANRYVVARQIDGASPQAPQRFTPEEFLRWARKQTRLAQQVYCCYEAGCFGYVLHRRLEAIGVTNFVVRPRNWDEYGEKVKTDNRDAGELLHHLDRYLSGNKRALQIVRVPTEEEERQRSESRQRDSLARERKRLQNQGNSAARYYGFSVPAEWWRPKKFAVVRKELPEHLVSLLEVWHRLLVAIDQELTVATARLERSNPRMLPVGLGALTATILDREVCDWNRFKNRRQVGGYTGLCPREDSSGGRRQQGSITKHGNPRIRHVSLEAIWRLFQFQPNYKPIVYWSDRIRSGPPLTKGRKKKIAVALTRQFVVDWWRIQTGRMKPEDVGLKLGLPMAGSLYKWRKAQTGQGGAPTA